MTGTIRFSRNSWSFYFGGSPKGKHLKEVRQAVQGGRCEFIQEYDENEYLPPAKGEPVIESVRFVAGEKLEDILSAYKK